MAQTDDILGVIDKAITAPSRALLSRWMRQIQASKGSNLPVRDDKHAVI